MIFLLISISCIFGILVIANRAWIKRYRIFERNICILLIILLIGIFIFSIFKFTEYKNVINQLSKPYTQIFSENVELYNFDENGNIIKEDKTIGGVLEDFFVHKVFDGRPNITNEEFSRNNFEVFMISVVLVLYWVIQLVIFEREKDDGNYEELDDFKIINKYNPMVAACIAQNRKATGKDLVAIILNLIEKEKLKLRIVSDETSNKIKYKYMITKNNESTYNMDMIEEYIYNWIFEKVPDFIKNRTEYDYIKVNDEGIIEIDLIKRLKSFSEDEDTYFRLKEIQQMANNRLKRIGANKKSVPDEVLFVNNIIMFFVSIVVCSHIYTNGLGIQINNVQILMFLVILLVVLFIIPLIYIFSLIILKTIMIFFKFIDEMGEKYTGRKLISRSLSIILTIMLLIIVVLALPIDTYLIYDVLIIGSGLLIILTDDEMLKHENKILSDYYNLKRIENKIKEYSLMKEENIEYIKMWDLYFVYSVALGIPLQVKSETNIGYSNMENLIINKTDLQAISLVCKRYFEVMWDFEFDNNNKNKYLELLSKIQKDIF